MTAELLNYDQAAAKVTAYASSLGQLQPRVETAEIGEAAGRVLAKPILADSDQPPFSRSTRDGYACRSAEASTHLQMAISGSTRAGQTPPGPLPPGTAWEIMTGAAVPEGADAVMMIEHVEAIGKTGSGRVRLLPPRTVEPGENIVAQGAQARAGDESLPAGTIIRFGQIALAASCGYATLKVFTRPRVAILTTGDELVSVASMPAPGQIRNSNAPMLAAQVAAAGGDPWVLPTAADNAEALNAALAQAITADLLLISGGVSAGKFDLVEPALACIGARFHFTGVQMQPGKPTVFGELPRDGGSTALPFFGLPGNPVSTAVTFLLFAAPVLAALAGSREVLPRFSLARFSPHSDRHGKSGLTRFLPAFCDFSARDENMPQVSFVPWHGSGDLSALARSNCFLVVPEDAHSFESGAVVRILLP